MVAQPAPRRQRTQHLRSRPLPCLVKLDVCPQPKPQPGEASRRAAEHHRLAEPRRFHPAPPLEVYSCLCRTATGPDPQELVGGAGGPVTSPRSGDGRTARCLPSTPLASRTTRSPAPLYTPWRRARSIVGAPGPGHGHRSGVFADDAVRSSRQGGHKRSTTIRRLPRSSSGPSASESAMTAFPRNSARNNATGSSRQWSRKPRTPSTTRPLGPGTGNHDGGQIRDGGGPHIGGERVLMVVVKP